MISTTLSNAEYHKSEGISKSGLDLIAKSPAHYKAGFNGINDDTARIGTAFHSMILENDNDLLLPPKRARRSGADKDFWAEWFVENGAAPGLPYDRPAAEWFPEFERQTGHTILTAQEKEAADQMVESVRSNNQADTLLSSGFAEQSVIIKVDGTTRRIRPDYVKDDFSVLVDLKTTASSARHAFRTSCAKYRYHVQDAFYSDTWHHETGVYPEFFFVVVEKVKPYACVVYKLDDESRENGHWLFERDLDTYRRCMETGIWPSYENDLNLDIPIYEPEVFEIIMDGQKVAI